MTEERFRELWELSYGREALTALAKERAMRKKAEFYLRHVPLTPDIFPFPKEKGCQLSRQYARCLDERHDWKDKDWIAAEWAALKVKP